MDSSPKSMPTVQEAWIYAMVVFGYIGCFSVVLIIIFLIYKLYRNQPKPTIQVSTTITTLNIVLWSSNLIACFEWACFRTNLFINLNETRCTIIYVSNYFFYMLGKYCLHVLLIYRIYLSFKGTFLRLNTKIFKLLIGLITIDFIIFFIAWVDAGVHDVTIGVIIPSKHLKICTLYNNDTISHISLYEQIWPILFGLQDFLVGVITLTLFVYKIHQLTSNHDFHDFEAEHVLRKITILGTITICSTFICFTFAIPFFPNLTFLLPLDTTINNITAFLLAPFANNMYTKICCGLDYILRKSLKHSTKDEDNITNMMQSVIIHTLPALNPTLSTVSTVSAVSDVVTDKHNILNMINLSKTTQPSIRPVSKKGLRELKLKNIYCNSAEFTRPVPALPLSQSKQSPFAKSSFL